MKDGGRTQTERHTNLRLSRVCTKSPFINYQGCIASLSLSLIPSRNENGSMELICNHSNVSHAHSFHSVRIENGQTISIPNEEDFPALHNQVGNHQNSPFTNQSNMPPPHKMYNMPFSKLDRESGAADRASATCKLDRYRIKPSGRVGKAERRIRWTIRDDLKIAIFWETKITQGQQSKPLSEAIAGFSLRNPCSSIKMFTL